VEQHPPPDAELERALDEGAYAADVAEAQAANVEVRVTGAAEAGEQRLRDHVRVRDVDLTREPQPARMDRPRHHQLLVGVDRPSARPARNRSSMKKPPTGQGRSRSRCPSM
jgi:hypothetical protein